MTHSDQVNNLNNYIEQSVTRCDIHFSTRPQVKQQDSRNQRKPKSAVGNQSRMLHTQHVMDSAKNQSSNGPWDEHGKAVSSQGEQLLFSRVKSDVTIRELEQHGLAYSPLLSTPINRTNIELPGTRIGNKNMNRLLLDIILKQRDLDNLKSQIDPQWLEDQRQAMKTQANLVKAYGPPSSYGVLSTRPKTSTANQSHHSTHKKSKFTLANKSFPANLNRERKASILSHGFTQQMKQQSQMTDGRMVIEMSEKARQIQESEGNIASKMKSQNGPASRPTPGSQANIKRGKGQTSPLQKNRGHTFSNIQSPTSLKLDLSQITTGSKKLIQSSLQCFKQKRNRRNISMTKDNPFFRDSYQNMERIVRQNCDKMLMSHILSQNNHTYKHNKDNESQKTHWQKDHLRTPELGSLSPEQAMFMNTTSLSIWNSRIEIPNDQPDRTNNDKILSKTPNLPSQTPQIFEIQKPKFKKLKLKKKDFIKAGMTKSKLPLEPLEELKTSLLEETTHQQLHQQWTYTQSKTRPEEEIDRGQQQRIQEELDALKQQMQRRRQANGAANLAEEEERKEDPMSNSDFFQHSLGRMSQIQEEAKENENLIINLGQNTRRQTNLSSPQSLERMNHQQPTAAQESTPFPACSWYQLAYFPQSMLKRFTGVIPPKPETNPMPELHETQQQQRGGTDETNPDPDSSSSQIESQEIETQEEEKSSGPTKTEIIIIQEPAKQGNLRLNRQETNLKVHKDMIKVGSVESEHSDKEDNHRLGEELRKEGKYASASNRHASQLYTSPNGLQNIPDQESLLNPLSASLLLKKRTMLIQKTQKSGKLDSKKLTSKNEVTEKYSDSDSDSFVYSSIETSEKVITPKPANTQGDAFELVSKIKKFSTFTKLKKNAQKSEFDINFDLLCQQYSKYNHQELWADSNKFEKLQEAESLMVKRNEVVGKFDLQSDSLGQKFLEKRFDLDLKFHEVILHYTFNLIHYIKTVPRENSHEVLRTLHWDLNADMYTKIFNKKTGQFKAKESPLSMILHSYDLNFKYIKDPRSVKKIDQNLKFIRTDGPLANEDDVDCITKFEFINYFRRTFIPNRHFLSEREDSIKSKFRTYLKEILQMQRNKKLARDIDTGLKDHMTYLELFLCSSGYQVKEEAQLIKIIYPKQLDEFVNPVLLNSLKTKAEVEGFENLLDLKLIEFKLELFNIQVQQQRKAQALSTKLLRSINKYLSQLGVSDYKLQNEKFSGMDAKIKAQLEKKEVNEIRSASVAMAPRVSSCLQQLIDLIHSRVILTSRFQRTRTLLVTTSSYVQAKRNEDRNLKKIDKMNLPISFSDYPAFLFVGNLQLMEVSRLIFSHNKYSLYKHIIVQENDVIMYALLDNLRKQSIKKENDKETMKTGSYEMLFGAQNMLIYTKPMQRSKTIKLIPRSQLAQLTRLNNQVFGPLVDKTRLTRFNSLLYEESPYRQAILINRYARQSTENMYDVVLCEYAIHEILKYKKDKIKDSQSIFYKNILRWIDMGDNNMNNEFRAEFCFKSQITRDLEFPSMIMEVFKATEVKTARMRIKKFIAKPVKRRQPPIEPKSIVQRLKEFEENQVRPKLQITKHLRSVMPQEFHTDDSMKDINFDDIKSVTSSDDENEQTHAEKLVKEEQRQSLLMKGRKTSLEYYKDLIQLKKQCKMRRHLTWRLKPKVFQVLSSSQYDQQDHSKSKHRLINQINLMVADSIKQIKHEMGEEIVQRGRQSCTLLEKVEQKGHEAENEDEIETPTLGRVKEKPQSRAVGSICNQSITRKKMFSVRQARKQLHSTQSLEIVHFQSLKFDNPLSNAKSIYYDTYLEVGNELELYQQARAFKEQRKHMNLSKLHRYNIIKQLQTQKKQSRLQGNGHQIINNHVLLKNFKLNKQMKTLTQKLGIQFQLELPKKKDESPSVILAKKKQFYSQDPEQHQKFKEEIFQIIHAKNYAKIEEMLKRYYVTTWNLQTDRGDSLLTMAVNMGDKKMVHIMLTSGMNPNTKNRDGDTALHFAINGQHMAIADLLINFGANENIKNNHGLTPWAKQHL